jgi:acyl carrier protein
VAAQTGDSIESLIARFARRPQREQATTLDELGLSSLERVELMVALEDRFQTRLDEGRFSEVANVADLKRLVEAPTASDASKNRSSSHRGTAPGRCASCGGCHRRRGSFH